jgi:hypothetical protein
MDLKQGFHPKIGEKAALLIFLQHLSIDFA